MQTLCYFYIFITLIKVINVKSIKYTHMGVSKGEGGGRWSPPNGWWSLVLGEGGPCRIWRSGGFPKLSRKIFPLKPFPPLSHPFSPPRPFPSILPPSNTSLQLSSLSLHQLLLPFYPPFFPSNLFLPPQGPYRTLSEHLRNPSIGSSKGPKQPFLGLFRPTPKRG